MSKNIGIVEVRTSPHESDHTQRNSGMTKMNDDI